MKPRNCKWTGMVLMSWIAIVAHIHVSEAIAETQADTLTNRCGSIPELLDEFSSLEKDYSQLSMKPKDEAKEEAGELIKKLDKFLVHKRCYFAWLDKVQVDFQDYKQGETLQGVITRVRDETVEHLDGLPDDFGAGRSKLKAQIEKFNIALHANPGISRTEQELYEKAFLYVGIVLRFVFSHAEIAHTDIKERFIRADMGDVIHTVARDFDDWLEVTIESIKQGSATGLVLMKVNPRAERLQELLGRDLSPGMKNRDGWTDLHYTAALNLPQHAQNLIDNGADVNARLADDKQRMTIESWSILTKIERSLDDWMERLGQTPLHLSAFFNSYELAQELMEANAEVNAESINGVTPLHYAARKDAYEVAELLINRGAGINQRSRDNGMTPLHYAARFDSPRVIQLLSEKGANLDEQDMDGLTPLHHAAYHGYTHVVGQLVRVGANSNIRNIDDHTPLDYAKGLGNREIERLLTVY